MESGEAQGQVLSVSASFGSFDIGCKNRLMRRLGARRARLWRHNQFEPMVRRHCFKSPHKIAIQDHPANILHSAIQGLDPHDVDRCLRFHLRGGSKVLDADLENCIVVVSLCGTDCPLACGDADTRAHRVLG